MRKLAAILLFLSTACARGGDVEDPDREAVAAAVGLYFQGHATGDGSFFRRAFHRDARLFWVKNGELMQKSSEEFAAGAAGKPADDEPRRTRRITVIDIAGDAAMAKLELAYPTVR